ncbi:MAG: conjugal transfer protein TrbI [Azoarcus sp.]|jgi:type IV secretion system protein VirB10|nr:conjugal transfer protein TrbI [Azoarcus sp.]
MKDDPMSPSASPSSAASSLFGGKRANKIPVYIGGAVVALFCAVMATVAVGRTEMAKQVSEENKAQPAGDSASIVQDIVGGYGAGLVSPQLPELQVARLDDPPLPSGERGKGEADDLPDAPTTARRDAAPAADPQLADMERARMEAVQQAAASGTSVQGAGGGRTGGGGGSSVQGFSTYSHSSSRPSASAQINERIKIAKDIKDTLFSDGAGGAGGVLLADAGMAQQGGYGQFDAPSREDRWRNPARLESPRTPFELRTGSVIPAVMISGINSDLPGPIIAQVSQSIYDTATGEQLLIPQGSRLFGAYDSNVIFGQSRVLFAWQRIVFPDGKAYDLGAMPGTDGAGYAGAADKVDHHYLRTFGSALLMSLVTAGVELSQDRTQGFGERQSASSAMSESLGQQLGQVTAQMVSKNMNVSPTIEIRPGFVFNVVVTKDLTLPHAYQPASSAETGLEISHNQP